LKIKICGITNSKDALLSERLGADALGFIFYPKSERFIEPESAKGIIKLLAPFTFKVGVFVNESSKKINNIAKEVGLTSVQLHGDEPPEQIFEINLPVIKSFRIKNDFNFDLVKNYKGCYYLFDTFSSSKYGGTGQTFDWKLIPNELRNKIILSGGISVSNIKKVFEEIRPYAIDVSSLLEEFPGNKSENKLNDFFNNLKGLK
jgi:phosphoribosylanthranilate isomerase